MVIRSIQNEDLFIIKDEVAQNTFYGCDQEWYTTEWQRRSGCGPTVVANILYYLNRTLRGSRTGSLPLTKSEALSLMEEVYQYVTPTPRGIPSTELLYDDVLNYAKVMALNMKLAIFNVPKNRVLRPLFHQLILFLDKALCNDTPIAFLNLDNGAEKRLDSWHWVTIISLEYVLDGSIAIISILDGGTIKKIDLAQWFFTTTLGGGFVSFDFV
ncbi:hypothetical protein [Desulfosporosinus sp. Sb-LF]|uniref:hypothetical protein n=1 Tax=Desulfosporosinus sp. Sb-LF TaxID=2560027 RepID=UPI00107F8A00|nr:hypothetical protein [Desulfosporosinus sp. Sb-LF]TGE31753.1 hypothetical protein E4K68_15230 [Desulfosporosinus sp. Sb-LF]